MTPGKIPDCRTLRWNGRKEDYERRVEDAVRSIPLATFSTVRGVTNISDKQLAETFRRLEDCGRIVNDQEFKLPGEYREGAGSALLRWVEHAVHGRIIGHFVKPGARDAGAESMTRPQHGTSKVGIPPRSGGRLRSVRHPHHAGYGQGVREDDTGRRQVRGTSSVRRGLRVPQRDIGTSNGPGGRVQRRRIDQELVT